MPRQFPPEFRQRALSMLEESLPDHETEYAAIRHVASKLGEPSASKIRTPSGLRCEAIRPMARPSTPQAWHRVRMSCTGGCIVAVWMREVLAGCQPHRADSCLPVSPASRRRNPGRRHLPT
jgi:hypothetical protein